MNSKFIQNNPFLKSTLIISWNNSADTSFELAMKTLF